MSPDPLQMKASVPKLSLGNVVTVGLKIFQLNFNDHFVRSLLSHLWLWLAIFGGGILAAVVIAIGVIINSATGLSPFSPVVVLSIGVGLLLFLPALLYTLARYTAVGGVMSRMGFNTLNHRVEPEELYRQTILRHLWPYLGGLLLFFLGIGIVYGGCIGLAVLAYNLFEPIWATWKDQSDAQLQWTLLLVAVILILLFVLGLGLIAYYLTARLWFFDTVLAIEAQHSAWQAFQRSWNITHGKGWAVATVMFIVTLVTLPITLIASVLNIFVPIFGLITTILFFPVWQAVKAVNYYELTAARSGLLFDLQTLSSDPRRFLRRVAMQTPEGVELDFALGGAGSRAFAWIIDQTILYMVLTLLTLAGALIYAYVLFPVLIDRFPTLSDKDLNLWALAIASTLGFAISNGYFILFETLWRGQTPGKRFAKVRVIRDDGQPIGVKEAALRSFVGWFDLGFFWIGSILILFNASEKRLGDIAAGTLVVQDEPISQTERLSTFPEGFSTLTHDTVEVLLAQSNPVALSLDHYFVLQNFLSYRNNLSRADCTQVTAQLARQLRALLVPESPERLGTIPDENLVEAAYLVARPKG
jgi:uncharacterized RDD family membrane protein YckC